MCKDKYEYEFSGDIDMSLVEENLALAMISAEGIYGRARVRMETQCDMNQKTRTCTVSADSEVGREICRVFTEFLILQFGEDRFRVQIKSHDNIHDQAETKRGCA